MQSSGGRGRRQGRHPTTRSTAAADANASTADETKSLSHYTPGATLNAPHNARTSPPETRSRTRIMTRSTRALEENERARARQAALQMVTVIAATLHSANEISKEEAERLVEDFKTLESCMVMDYLRETIGDEKAQKGCNLFRQHQHRRQNPMARMQQGSMGNVEGLARGGFSMQDMRMLPGFPVNRPTMAVHHMPPLRFPTAAQVSRRPEHNAFQAEAISLQSHRATMPGPPAVPTVRNRIQTGGIQAAGEVAKTLMPQRADPMSYSQSHYGMPIATTARPLPEYTAAQSNGTERRPAAEQPVSNKRPAPVEQTAPKNTRCSKARRASEDPNAPDAGDIDVLEDAEIQLEAEQQALMSNVSTQTTEPDGQLIKSNLLEVQNVRSRLQQVLREQGMQLSGSEAVDMVIHGMEEKFEQFLKKALKRALHRSATGYVHNSTNAKTVTSDVRSKLREIKKKQEQHKANKLREEREKLEQLAETASKKELARDKELAAKVERVKKQKQLSAEREATHRALSNALGSLSFENFHKRQKEKQSKGVTVHPAPVPVRTVQPPALPPPPISRPTASITQPPPSAQPSIPDPPASDTVRPAVVTVTDVFDVMSNDPHYAFSSMLYEFYLSYSRFLIDIYAAAEVILHCQAGGLDMSIAVMVSHLTSLQIAIIVFHLSCDLFDNLVDRVHFRFVLRVSLSFVYSKSVAVCAALSTKVRRGIYVLGLDLRERLRISLFVRTGIMRGQLKSLLGGSSHANEDSRSTDPVESDSCKKQPQVQSAGAGGRGNAQDSKQPDVGSSVEKPTVHIPTSYCCPISMDIMVEPVIVATGHTYDKECIQTWLSQGNRTCPATGQKLRHLELVPNFALRNAIQEWATQNNVKLRDHGESYNVPISYRDEGPRNILQGHEEIVWAVEAHGNRLFSASADKTIRVWDIESRRCEQVLEDHSRPVLSLAISNNKLFSGSYDYTIKVWNLDTLTKIKTLEGHTDAVRALAVAGNRLFSGSYDSTVRVWNVDSLDPIQVLRGHMGPVRTLVYARGMMFSGSYDKTVRVWNVESLDCRATLSGHAGAVRALVASSNHVFSGSDDHTIKVWSTDSLHCVKNLEGHEDNVRVLTVGQNYMFSGSWDKTIRVWNLQTLECVKTLEGHSEAVLALAVGNRHLVSGSYDTTVRFWDLETFRCAKKCEGHDDAVRVLAAADGNVFSGSYDGSIGVW